MKQSKYKSTVRKWELLPSAADSQHDQTKWIKNVTREVTVFPATGVTRSFGQVSQAFDIPFDYEHILFVNNTWYYKEQDYNTIKEIFRHKIEEDVNYIFEILSKQKQVGKKLKRYIQALIRKRFSRQELVDEIAEYDARMTEFYAFWWMAIPAGEVLEEKIRSILAKKRSTLQFEDVMFVRDELKLIREKRLRNALNLKYKAYANYTNLPHTLKRKLEKHAEEFGWINTSYHIGRPLTAEDFFAKIKQEDVVAETQQMSAERKREKQVLQTLAEEFTLEEQRIIEAMQGIIYLRNYQKETVNECQYRSEPFLRQAATSLHIDLNTLLSLSPQEVSEYLVSSSVSSEEIWEIVKKRTEGLVIEYKDKKIFFPEESKKYQALVGRDNDFTGTKEIRGSAACRGSVTGRVRVVTKKEDLVSFAEGEILVTVMTSIDYVHTMKRAAAIVTDEGGITCHAAIFSREFGIPCIIGTKIATQVLKDGDMVEVNADAGVVRILEHT